MQMSIDHALKASVDGPELDAAGSSWAHSRYERSMRAQCPPGSSSTRSRNSPVPGRCGHRPLRVFSGASLRRTSITLCLHAPVRLRVLGSPHPCSLGRVAVAHCTRKTAPGSSNVVDPARLSARKSTCLCTVRGAKQPRRLSASSSMERLLDSPEADRPRWALSCEEGGPVAVGSGCHVRLATHDASHPVGRAADPGTLGRICPLMDADVGAPTPRSGKTIAVSWLGTRNAPPPVS